MPNSSAAPYAVTPGRPPSAPVSLDATLAVETPEQVTLTYTLAGFGSRALAAIVDALLLGGVMLGLGVLFVTLTSSVAGITGLGTVPWAVAILLLLEFAIFWGYFVAFEALNDGQTPGKRLLKLRVVRDGGYSITFAASAVRNLVRILDIQPAGFHAVGAVSILVTKSGKRLGDLLAGTFVVHEGKATYDFAALPASAAGVVTPTLRDAEYDLLERYVARRGELEPERRRMLAAQVAQRLSLHLDPTEGEAKALLTLFERERAARAASVAGRSDTGTQREQHAIVALGVARWNEFSVKLTDVRKKGLRTLRPAEVSDFVERYRQISTDLARLQTASRGRTFGALFFVSRLVAGGHAVLYRRRVRGTATALRYLAVDVPREIRRSALPIGLAALLFFGPAIAAYTVVVRNPSTAERFVPPVMIERAEEGKERMQHHKGYIDLPEFMRPVAASSIIQNNIQVCFLAFVLGLTAGVGTILVLIGNGISIGGGFGVFQAKGVASLLVGFVAGHSVLELSSVCIAGGAGLLIGSAIVLPGAMTRREALIMRGRRAMRLISATILFLLVAGSIEGLISPRVWPLSWKFAVSGTTAILMAAYLSLGWRGAADEPELERGTVF